MAKLIISGGSHQVDGRILHEVQRDLLNWGAMRPLLTVAFVGGGGFIWSVLRGLLHLPFEVTAAILGPIVLIGAFFLPFPGDRDAVPQKKR